MSKHNQEISEPRDAPDQSPEDAIDEDWYEEECLEDAENRKGKKYFRIAILLIPIALICAFLWFMNNRNWRFSMNPSPNQQAEEADIHRKSKAIDNASSSQKNNPPEAIVRFKTSEQPKSGMDGKLAKAARLRKELLKKQEEVRTLKHYYGIRIKEVEDEILNEKGEKGITTFQSALNSKRIELGLRTIQRRHIYINKLNRPLEQLHRGSEALRYIKWLAEIQIQMAPIVNDIDIVTLGKRMDVIIEKESSGVDSLAIDTEEADAPSLEEIWNEIVHKEDVKKKPERKDQKEEKPINEKTHPQRQDIINRVIWKEICLNNLSRKDELTKLSLDAAKCLSNWKGTDLFLNGLKELPASIAEQLSQWEGEWLCLNSLTELSPEAAGGLSRWPGSRLSLNGLVELTPQAAKQLSQWRGKHMEIVGLTKISSEANKYLTAWQKSGGKLYERILP